MGGVVPLSEHEQRQLEQIEQALYKEDPKFGRLVRSSDPRVHYKRKLVQALIGMLVGAGLIATGVVTRHLYLEAAGAAFALLSLVWALVTWRRHAARVRAVQERARPSARGRSAGRRKSDLGWKARMMERMEERWRHRQEGNRRM
jgi:Flp pilus assembly protein TadB